jgi:signal transduction histidine kinase
MDRLAAVIGDRVEHAEAALHHRGRGAGFDPATVVDGAGLSNIADRVAAAGGTVRIDSAPGLGTRVDARLPA